MQIMFGYFANLVARSNVVERSLRNAVLAEEYGFDPIWVADHFHPWIHTDAAGAFAWTWIASAAEKTKNVKLGTCVTAPILRYHPAIVAQAFATLDYFYPGRIILGLGTGEAMNEIPLGYNWPAFSERLNRLEEAVQLIRLLWQQDFVSFKGIYYQTRDANLYTKPKNKIPIFIAASGPKSAKLAGKYGDGLITTSFEEDYYSNRLFPALREGAREANRKLDQIIKVVQITGAYDEDLAKAIESSKGCAADLIPGFLEKDISDPRETERYGVQVDEELLLQRWIISNRPEEHINRIAKFLDMQFDGIQICSYSPDEEEFIKMYGEKVLPYFRTAKSD